MKVFWKGFRAMLPITTGVIPFGAVMGTVFSEAKLSFFQAISMNTLVFAGASQLAAIDLMTRETGIFVVVATGVIINMRFTLYSAAMSSALRESSLWVKCLSAYCLTDQNYAVMTAHQNQLKELSHRLPFYFGASCCMVIAWQSSVIAGFIFGNFAPESWALEYAVPLSFAALVIPTLKNFSYFAIAFISAVCSVILKPLPYNLGLIITALLSISIAFVVFCKKGQRQ